MKLNFIKRLIIHDLLHVDSNSLKSSCIHWFHIVRAHPGVDTGDVTLKREPRCLFSQSFEPRRGHSQANWKLQWSGREAWMGKYKMFLEPGEEATYLDLEGRVGFLEEGCPS